MSAILLVAFGGGLGAVTRHLFGLGAARVLSNGFPFGTFGVNVLGSLLMGILVASLAGRTDANDGMRLLLATGFLGGFTTFSSFSLDIVALFDRGQAFAAMLYAGGSVVAGVVALLAGVAVGRAMF